MSSLPPQIRPVPYAPSVEVPEEDEEQTTNDLIEQMTKIQEIVFKDHGHALRSVHAKSHGLLNATLVVPAGLPVALAQGIFATPGSYPVVMRYSAIPGDSLDDDVSTPRGLSIKILGVEGARLPGSEGDTTQDFVMVNGPAFSAKDAKKFLGNVKLLAATTDKAPGAKKALSSVFQVIERGIEAVGGKSATLIALGGHPETNVLGETYYTQVPMRYGDYIAKLSVAPATAALKALTNAKVDLADKPHGLRDAVVDFFATEGAEWDVRIQLCTDLEAMPIEDASVAWPEDRSPYVTVARLVATPQPAWTDARAKVVDEGLSFSPWHGVMAHRPLGNVMRTRKRVYEASVAFRASHGGPSIVEPDAMLVLPG
jgi:hypothetical protein